ncbi:MAG: hypothetical protein ABWK05_01540 [Pyrobaculum sp.]
MKTSFFWIFVGFHIFYFLKVVLTKIDPLVAYLLLWPYIIVVELFERTYSSKCSMIRGPLYATFPFSYDQTSTLLLRDVIRDLVDFVFLVVFLATPFVLTWAAYWHECGRKVRG